MTMTMMTMTMMRMTMMMVMMMVVVVTTVMLLLLLMVAVAVMVMMVMVVMVVAVVKVVKVLMVLMVLMVLLVVMVEMVVMVVVVVVVIPTMMMMIPTVMVAIILMMILVPGTAIFAQQELLECHFDGFVLVLPEFVPVKGLGILGPGCGRASVDGFPKQRWPGRGSISQGRRRARAPGTGLLSCTPGLQRPCRRTVFFQGLSPLKARQEPRATYGTSSL